VIFVEKPVPALDRSV